MLRWIHVNQQRLWGSCSSALASKCRNVVRWKTSEKKNRFHGSATWGFLKAGEWSSSSCIMHHSQIAIYSEDIIIGVVLSTCCKLVVVFAVICYASESLHLIHFIYVCKYLRIFFWLTVSTLLSVSTRSSGPNVPSRSPSDTSNAKAWVMTRGEASCTCGKNKKWLCLLRGPADSTGKSAGRREGVPNCGRWWGMYGDFTNGLYTF